MNCGSALRYVFQGVILDTARIGNLQWRDFLPHLKGFVDTMGHNTLRALDPLQSIRSFIFLRPPQMSSNSPAISCRSSQTI